MTLSPLTLRDYREASTLHQEAFFTGWSDTSFQELLQTPHTFGIQMREKENLLGYILWREIEDEAEILTFVIATHARQKGRGSALLNALCARLKRKEIQSLFIEVAEDNIPALSFYQKHAFTLLGKRKNYYARENNTYICAMTFQKKLHEYLPKQKGFIKNKKDVDDPFIMK